ncbi:hypothetical protein ABK040_011974 [Willaertia magna]
MINSKIICFVFFILFFSASYTLSIDLTKNIKLSHQKEIKQNPNSGYFWHLTDPHIDLSYREGSNINCGEIVCCRQNSPKTENFQPAKKFGSYGGCDIPLDTFINILHFVANYSIEADFLLYGGDNLVHDDWNYSQEYNLHYGLLVGNLLQNEFREKSFKNRIYPAIGNHDLYPIDQFRTDNNNWYLQPVGQAYSFSLNGSSLDSFTKRGYYTVPITKGFNLVVLNTQYEDTYNFWLYKNSTDNDPGLQLKWLESTLQNYLQNGEKVLILGHIPPGIKLSTNNALPESLISFNTQFDILMQKYGSIIVGQFYGHTHTDHFKVFKDSTQQQATSVAFVSPSMTNWEYNHPAVRLIEYNRKTFELENIYTFNTNLDQLDSNGNLVWKLEYDMLSEYQLKDLSPTSFLNLGNNRLFTDKNAWDAFRYHYNADYYKKGSVCQFGTQCHKNYVCAMLNINYEGFNKCLKL